MHPLLDPYFGFSFPTYHPPSPLSFLPLPPYMSLIYRLSSFHLPFLFHQTTHHRPNSFPCCPSPASIFPQTFFGVFSAVMMRYAKSPVSSFRLEALRMWFSFDHLSLVSLLPPGDVLPPPLTVSPFFDMSMFIFPLSGAGVPLNIARLRNGLLSFPTRWRHLPAIILHFPPLLCRTPSPLKSPPP